MGDLDNQLDRLLRAARAGDDAGVPSDVPFGFETRVLALWKSQRAVQDGDVGEFLRWLRGIGAGALAVIALAGAGAWWQFQQNNELAQPMTNAYAIADTAIERIALR